MNEQFLKDVNNGLSKKNKMLPSKYFYDKKGDALFVQIMAMPEYYLTRAEMDIFKNKTEELISALAMDKTRHYELIELGAGDGTKTIELLRKLLDKDYQFSYLPIDISSNALNGLQEMLGHKLPHLDVIPQAGDYFETLNELHKNKNPKIILFLGSNIGNLIDQQATKFIYKLGENLCKGDKILLGVDLIKSKEIVSPAYNDKQGITREFNLNLLDRINREFGADFDRNYFEHFQYYQENEGIAKSYIKSKIKQVVTIKALKKAFVFEENEMIHTEVSRKYNDTVIADILKETDITVEKKIMDSKKLFADYILIRN